MYRHMLCQKGSKEVLTKIGFIFEPKLDGTRVFIVKDKNDIQLINRRSQDIIWRYPELLHVVRNIKGEEVILDAELVILDKDGRPDFNLLQQREQETKPFQIEIKSKKFPATLFVFDVLKINGEELLDVPIEKRKKILEKLIREDAYIRMCPFTLNGKELWKRVEELGLEGVIAKRLGSVYQQERSWDWLKIKKENTIDCVVVGYKPGKGNRKNFFGSLALACFDSGRKKFVYVGNVGTGFDEKKLREIKRLLKKVKKIKFLSGEDIKKLKENEIVFVKPFVVEVKYLEVTKNRELRAPVFLRVRFDKKVSDCELP